METTDVACQCDDVDTFNIPTSQSEKSKYTLTGQKFTSFVVVN